MVMDEKCSLLGRLISSFKRDYHKFGELGYGKYVALLTVALHFTLELEILKAVWPHIHGSIPDIPLYAISLVVVNLIVTILYNVFMYFVYTRKIPFFEQFRASKNTPWPWESNQKQWGKIFWDSIKVNIINIFVIGPSVTLFDSIMDFRFKMDLESAPNALTMVWQMSIFLLVQQLSFYWVHRIIHHPRLYWIHKVHHEFNVTVSLTPQYAHPIEHIFANTIPVGLGYKFLSKVYPVHIFTILIWITLRMLQTCDGHSGYNWPWGQSQLLPFSAGGSYHYFHHKQNVGNYGAVLNLFDTVFDTNKDYYKYLKSQGHKND